MTFLSRDKKDDNADSAPSPISALLLEQGKAPGLTLADRCDRCGAEAYVSVKLPGGSQLLFCKHHGRLYADAMKAKGFELRGSLDFASASA